MNEDNLRTISLQMRAECDQQQASIGDHMKDIQAMIDKSMALKNRGLRFVPNQAETELLLLCATYLAFEDLCSFTQELSE